MKSPKKEIKITLRLDAETHKTLQMLADKHRRNFTDFIRTKLEDVIIAEKEKNKNP